MFARTTPTCEARVELPQILILLVIVLLVFGAKRLPEIARSLGTSTREFKKGISGEVDDGPPPPTRSIEEQTAQRKQDDTPS